jgi:hypothetical protein
MENIFMQRLLAVVLLFCCAAAYAKDKNDPQYQDAVLVSFRNISTGSSCSSYGNTNGAVDDDGRVAATTNSSSSCFNNTARLYTIKVEDHTYVIKPAATGGQKLLLLPRWAGALSS